LKQLVGMAGTSFSSGLIACAVAVAVAVALPNVNSPVSAMIRHISPVMNPSS
jgi:hypothetical protein